MSKRFVVIDLETTGNSPKKGDRIIQFAAVVIEDGEIIERFATFVNPNKKIPIFIEQFTGISDDVVANAPDFSVVAPEILSMCQDAYFVAHNVPFDYSFLQEELARCGYPSFECLTIDTVELSRVMLPLADSYKLGQLAESLSLSHDNPHQADSDAEVTAEILLKIINKIHRLPLVTIQKLYKLSKSFKSDVAEIFSEIMEQKMSHSAEEHDDLDIYRGIALRKINEGRYEKGNRENTYSGNLLSDIKDFSFRKGQQEMLELILNALETNQHALIEAGTGIGKSIAYLLPLIYMSKIKGRSVISTNTLQLQQQLFEKDIEIVRKIVTIPFRVELLKGKGNYLSLRKFEQVLYEDTNNYDEILTKAQILVWLTETGTGDIDEINLPSGGMLLWERVKCRNSKANLEDNLWESRCFYNRARNAAEKADIIITNHALLLRDISEDFGILPSYKYVVIDEAHHLEILAKKHVGANLNFLTIHASLSQLGLLETNELLAKSWKILKSTGIENSSFDEVNRILKEMKSTASDLFRAVRSHVLQNKSEVQENNRIQYLYDSKVETGEYWQEAIEYLLSIRILKKELSVHVNNQREFILNHTLMLTPMHIGVLNDYLICFDTLEEVLDRLEELLLSNQRGPQISWIEIDPKGPVNAASLYTEPADISDYLADHFFRNKNSVVMTSATLTVNQSFQYTIEKNGLRDFNPITISIPSPFDYQNQAAVMIPTDLPTVNSVSLEEYIHSVAVQIAEIARKTNGRMLVLFTSYEMLRKTYQYLKGISFLDQFVLIAQSISSGSRAKLTKNFQAFDKAILLGTNSFWEGIDIPGEDLTALVIVRLPFSPPNDPVFAVKAKQIEVNGGDSFNQLSLPEAIIRFKQGVGRLIRSENDKGIIFIMDRRIVTKSYGREFLGSIPPMKVYEMPLQQLLQHVDKWV